MKKIVFLVLFCLFVGGLALDDANARHDSHRIIPSPVSRLNTCGDITGEIDLVGGCLVEGTTVYLAGYSFVVKTDGSGFFRFYNVPSGTYYLMVEPPGGVPQYGDTVRVYIKQLTDVGTIQVTCPPSP